MYYNIHTMKNTLNQIPVPLLTWYEEHKRTLPWRSDPVPYKVWLSEIMLQQTRVAAVLPYFARFLEACPTVSHLAAAELDSVFKLWQGLGYYSRARSLHKTAQILCDQYGGEFPADYDALRALPGIGDYTAAAISSIAFGLPTPVVDGNVLRVVTRLTADNGDVLKQPTKRRITAALADVIPTKAAAAFNQAMMELGALICLPNGAPLCKNCPLAFCCQAYGDDTMHCYPVKPPKKPRRIEERTVYFVLHNRRLALRQRPEKGLLAGLYEYPNECEAPTWHISGHCEPQSLIAKHIFTHIEWHMTAVIIRTNDEALPAGWLWATRQELARQYTIPSAFSAFSPLVEQLFAEPDSPISFIPRTR